MLILELINKETFHQNYFFWLISCATSYLYKIFIGCYLVVKNAFHSWQYVFPLDCICYNFSLEHILSVFHTYCYAMPVPFKGLGLHIIEINIVWKYLTYGRLRPKNGLQIYISKLSRNCDYVHRKCHQNFEHFSYLISNKNKECWEG